MSRPINRAVIEHLVDIDHRDLIKGDVTIQLVAAAGDAIADVLLDHGFQLERSYMDGRDIVHCYINPRTGVILDGIGFSLGLINNENCDPNLAVLLRTDAAQPDQSLRFCKPLRSSKSWYLPMSNSATAEDIFSVAVGKQTDPAYEWRDAA